MNERTSYENWDGFSKGPEDEHPDEEILSEDESNFQDDFDDDSYDEYPQEYSITDPEGA